MRNRNVIGLSVLLAFMSVSAMADCVHGHCEPVKPIFHYDKPAKVNEDCSFADAGNGWESDFSGTAAKDIGGGRVGQRWVLSAACVRSESVVVVDCNSSEFIRIQGVCTPPNSEYPETLGLYSADLLYQPHGRLRLSSTITIQDLAQLSKWADYVHWTDFEGTFSRVKRKNRINPFCGCKLYYPDSPGAKL